jgi:hypothetical protein
LAERTGLEPAREFLDGLANRYGYRFVISPKLKKALERVIGIEPMSKAFAEPCLNPLGYTRERI